MVFKNLPRQMGGDFFRSWIGKRLFSHYGRNAVVHEGVHFGKGEKLYLGDFSYIGRCCFIALDSEVKIGNYVMIGPEVMIFTANHGTQLSGTMMFQPTEKKPVFVEDDVWIGARCILLPGVRFGSGAVIAAGSVVASDVPAECIAAGVPAKVLRKRS